MKKYKLSDKEFKFFDNSDDFAREITAPRSNCILDTTKLEKYVKIRATEDALRDSLAKYMLS